MFESAELGHKIDKATFDKQAPRLRADLLDAQYDMGALKKYAVIILVNGVNGAGKGETVNLLNAWMDPRHIQTHAFPPPTDEERERPFMWRFWRALPPKGKIGILFGNWYTDPIVNRARKITKAADLDQSIEEINPGPVEAVTASGATRMQSLVYAVAPQLVPPFLAFIIYQWDINIRMSTVIGFVGGGGIGQQFRIWVSLNQYGAAGTAIWAIVIMVWTMDYLSAKARENLV